MKIMLGLLLWLTLGLGGAKLASIITTRPMYLGGVLVFTATGPIGVIVGGIVLLTENTPCIFNCAE